MLIKFLVKTGAKERSGSYYLLIISPLNQIESYRLVLMEGGKGTASMYCNMIPKEARLVVSSWKNNKKSPGTECISSNGRRPHCLKDGSQSYSCTVIRIGFDLDLDPRRELYSNKTSSAYAGSKVSAVWRQGL